MHANSSFLSPVSSSRALAAALILCGALSGCSDDEGMAANAPDADLLGPDAALPDAALPRETIVETRTLEPGELIEAILAGGPEDSAVVHLEAPVEELDWNIHGHADGSTQTVFEELNQMTVDYTFTPPAEADWYLLLRNSGSADMDVQLRVELYGDMSWEWL